MSRSGVRSLFLFASTLTLSACQGLDVDTSVCPTITLVKGLERAELRLTQDGRDAPLDLRFGQVQAECELDDEQLALLLQFDILVQNDSRLQLNGLSAAYFVAVMRDREVIDKTVLQTPAISISAGDSIAVTEQVTQRLLLDTESRPSNYTIAIGFDLPRDIGLRQRANP